MIHLQIGSSRSEYGMHIEAWVNINCKDSQKHLVLEMLDEQIVKLGRERERLLLAGIPDEARV